MHGSFSGATSLNYLYRPQLRVRRPGVHGGPRHRLHGAVHRRPHAPRPQLLRRQDAPQPAHRRSREALPQDLRQLGVQVRAPTVTEDDISSARMVTIGDLLSDFMSTCTWYNRAIRAHFLIWLVQQISLTQDFHFHS